METSHTWRTIRLLLIALSVLVSACTTEGATTTTAAPTPTNSTLPTTAPPTTTTTTQAPTTTTAVPLPTATISPREVWVFPGPAHYEGDVLSFQVPLEGFDDVELTDAILSIDGEAIDSPGRLSGDPLLGNYVAFLDVYETTDKLGSHAVSATATVDGEPITVSADFEVLPDSERPPQEVEADWETVTTECCTVKYVTGSAAERDLADLIVMIDESADLVAEQFEQPTAGINMALLDILWGNGGYAGSEVVISYLDRDFGPTTESTVNVTFIHELVHAMSRTVLKTATAPWPLDEAMAVYVTGGHFKVENIPARTKALDELGRLLPLEEFFDTFPDLQHESRYVQAGGFANYVADAYGWDQLLAFYTADVSTWPESAWVDAAAQQVLGVTIEQLDSGFAEWVAGQDAGPELRDLEVTIALQTARREYQALYAPYQGFFLYPSVTDTDQPATALREADEPVFAAIEAYISWGQHRIVEGDYANAASVAVALERIVATGEVDGPILSQFLAVALELDAQGFELLSMEFESEGATVFATGIAPHIEKFDVVLDGGSVQLSQILEG